FLQLLDFAHAHVGGKFRSLGDAALRIAGPGSQGATDDVRCHFAQMIRAQAVPPTVMRSILRVGMPSPTGTLWPSLPHTPMPSSSFKSCPTMLTYFSASGPLPINVALRTGRVILPSSIR